MTMIFENDLPSNLKIKDCIAIDTETMGLKPFRDRLCVVQIATVPGDIYLVQFKNKYKAPNLCKLLKDSSICKIFHYARFDIATIKHHLKCSVNNVFCTKIGSILTRTYTERHGLKNLIKELLDIELDKKEQSSDWGADVLSDKQKEYAANDVKHLIKVKNILEERLKREGREDLAKACFNFLPTRVRLDLEFGEECDIFAHRVIRNG